MGGLLLCYGAFGANVGPLEVASLGRGSRQRKSPTQAREAWVGHPANLRGRPFDPLLRGPSVDHPDAVTTEDIRKGHFGDAWNDGSDRAVNGRGLARHKLTLIYRNPRRDKRRFRRFRDHHRRVNREVASQHAVAALLGRTRCHHVNMSMGPAGYRKREYLTECRLVTRNLAELQQTRRCRIVRKGRKGFLILIASHDINDSVQVRQGP